MSPNDYARQQLIRSADPEDPLPDGDERYVDCAKERGTERLFGALVDGIRLAGKPICRLLTGHRGCGKTTELFRVKTRLEQGSPRFFTVYFKAEEYLALQDTGPSDLLLAVAASVWQDVKERTDRKLEVGLFKRILDGIGDLIGSVQPDGGEISYGIAKLKLTFRQNPTNRKLVRERLDPDTPSLVQAVNEVLARARESLSDSYSGIVVIADNLDRMPRRQLPNSPLTNQELLFVDSWDLLQSLDCHSIFTLPPAICRAPSVERLSPLRIPMIPWSSRDGSAFEAGVARLREIVEKRARHARHDIGRLFDSDETFSRLCRLSGGRERMLLVLLQECILSAVPIAACDLDMVYRDRRDTMHNALQGKSQHWEALRKVRATKERPEDPDLIENFYVLEYRDARGYWYDVNPLISECGELNG